MAALPVGVVGHQIPGGEADEGISMVRIVTQREVVLLIVARHVQLDGPLTQWAVPNHGGWDEAPSQLGGKLPGRGLPPVDPCGEVVEWSFAPGRLVDALEVRVGSGRRVGDVDQEGGVGRPRHPTQDFNVAFSEYLDG